MKNNGLIALFDNSNNLVGYFHDEDELNEYMLFLERRKINTKGWRTGENNFKV